MNLYEVYKPHPLWRSGGYVSGLNASLAVASQMGSSVEGVIYGGILLREGMFLVGAMTAIADQD